MPKIKVTRAAMAVLEECRRGDRWAEEPVYLGNGFQLEVDDATAARLAQLTYPGEDASAVILRAYRAGGAIRPAGAP